MSSFLDVQIPHSSLFDDIGPASSWSIERNHQAAPPQPQLRRGTCVAIRPSFSPRITEILVGTLSKRQSSPCLNVACMSND